MQTIWSKDSIPLVPKRFRPLYQVFLPLVDLGMLWFSAVAIVVGSQVVADFTLEWFPYMWAAVVGVGAILASIGLIFMRDYMELIGKGLLCIGLWVYAAVLLIYVLHGSTSSLLTQDIALLLTVGLLIRIGDLIGEIGRKEGDRER